MSRQGNGTQERYTEAISSAIRAAVKRWTTLLARVTTAARLTGSLTWLFVALALGLVAYGGILSAAIGSGAWFGRQKPIAIGSPGN